MILSFTQSASTSVALYESPLANSDYELFLTLPAVNRSYWIICEMWDKWFYTSYFLGYCFQDVLKKPATSLCFPYQTIFSKHCIKIQVVQPYNSTDTATVWKKSLFILSNISNLQMLLTC